MNLRIIKKRNKHEFYTRDYYDFHPFFNSCFFCKTYVVACSYNINPIEFYDEIKKFLVIGKMKLCVDYAIKIKKDNDNYPYIYAVDHKAVEFDFNSISFKEDIIKVMNTHNFLLIHNLAQPGSLLTSYRTEIDFKHNLLIQQE